MTALALRQIVHYIRGVASDLVRNAENASGNKVICIKKQNIHDEIDLTDALLIQKEIVRREEQYIQSNDILIFIQGREAKGQNTVGRIAFLEHVDFEATVDRGIGILRVHAPHVSPRYLFYWMKSPYGQFYINKCSSGINVLQSIEMERLLDIQVPIPSKDEQEKIVSTLDKVYTLLKKQKEMLYLSEKLADNYALQAFSKMNSQ